jgi:hypothetical protein
MALIIMVVSIFNVTLKYLVLYELVNVGDNMQVEGWTKYELVVGGG